MYVVYGGGMSMRQLHGIRRYMVLEVNNKCIWANGLGLVFECSISSQALRSQTQITYFLGLSSKVLEGKKGFSVDTFTPFFHYLHGNFVLFSIQMDSVLFSLYDIS